MSYHQCSRTYNKHLFFLFLFQNLILFIYFWLCWGLTTELDFFFSFSNCGEWKPLSSYGAQASHYGDLSCYKAQAQATRARGFNNSGFQTLERKLSSCGEWVQPPHDMKNPSGPEMETGSLILPGRLPTTEPPGKP